MKKILNKWQFVLQQDSMSEYGVMLGWKRVTFGIFKLTKLPPEGATPVKKEYKGFIIRFLYWLPIRNN